MVILNNLGQYGILPDREGLSVPINAWTDGNNVVFRDGIAQKVPGHTQVFGTPGARPQWLLPYVDPVGGSYYWIYAGLDNSGDGVIYTYDGTNHVDRTRAAGVYNPAANVTWSGGILNGLPIINNGVDVPQKWDRTSGTLNSDFEDLANWPAGYTARIMRPFGNFLLGLDIDDGTNPRNPYRIMWSTPADPFTEPSSWTPSATNLAGNVDLAEEGGGYLVDCLPLRGVNFVYKEQTVWIMRYIGGNNVFAFEQIFAEHGLLAPRCVKAYKDGRHFVVTKGDIIIHDGNTVESVADRRVRDTIFNEINSDYYERSFVAPNYRQNEFWFCYPAQSSELPDKAAIWNAKYNTWSFRDLDNVAHIGWGVIQVGDNTWDSDSQVWDDDSSPWDATTYNETTKQLVLARQESTAAASRFYLGDDTNQFDGTNYTAYLKRTGLHIVGNQNGQIVGDITTTKDIEQVWLRLTGGPVLVRIGVADNVGDAYSWTPAQTLDPSNGDYKVDVRANGRLWGIWIESVGDVAWELHEVTVWLVPDGER